MQKYRRIIHVDMDAFYASVEQRDNPELKGRPIAVGHPDERGVVAAASYEARRFGVHSAMPSKRALKLCPSLVFVTPRFEVYKAVSAQMHDIFHEYTDIIEPISLDEAFLDVTDNKPGIDLAVTIAKEVKQKIRDRLSLTASAGISYNKFLAKIASDFRKPDGLFSIHPDSAMEFIARLPIEAFWGVGPVTAKKMHLHGINNGAELRRFGKDELRKLFGKNGAVYYNFARGIDYRPVTPERVRKSVGCESTFDHDIYSDIDINHELAELSLNLQRRIERAGFKGRTLTVKIKFHDFSQITRSYSTNDAICYRDDIMKFAMNLVRTVNISADNPVRLLGLSVSNPESYIHLQSDAESFGYDWRQLVIDFDGHEY